MDGDEGQLYIVQAYRYGNSEGYNFPIGVCDSIESSLSAARSHADFRGGKYSHKIWAVKLNSQYDAEEAAIIFNSCKD